MVSTKLVVDSSVIVKWLNQDKENHLNKADLILANVQQNSAVLFAPELAKYEVGNVLLLGKKLSPEQANIARIELFRLPITFVPESIELALETFNLAFELKITYYDASFLCLAEKLGAALVTDNVKYQGKSTKVKVISLKDY